MDALDNITRFHQRISGREQSAIAKITSCVLFELQNYARRAGFVQILPVMISPFTDPLNHAVYPAEIDYEGRRLKLTASMIFHKQIALNLSDVDKIFIVSPNIRLEKAAVKNSTNHLLEFSQFDLEIRDASMHDVMAFVDGMVRHVLKTVKQQCSVELSMLGRQLPDFDTPFDIHASADLQAQYGDDFETRISKESPAPCFVTNFKREFYDRETPGVRGQYNNFDLIYSEGFGEGLSGAEREFEHDQILYRMDELKMDRGPFEQYIECSARGHIPRTAGAGLGVQRLIKFICGRGAISDVCLFDRSITSDFLF
jgi:asparaginyl-tRNA synthetase